MAVFQEFACQTAACKDATYIMAMNFVVILDHIFVYLDDYTKQIGPTLYDVPWQSHAMTSFVTISNVKESKAKY